MSSTKVSLKLLVDNKSKRVLFAEAGKDFVDFLFNLLALPVGTVIRLLRKRSMVGSLANLYGSIEELSDTYLQSTYTKDSLLKPKVSASASQVPLLLADKDCYVKDTSNTTARVYMYSFYRNCSSSRLSTNPKEEAGKDFVDFLFNLLALPVCTVIRLLRKKSVVGSLANLYGSIEELSDTYLQSTYTKDSLLKPKVSASASQVPLLLADKDCYVNDTSNTTERVYMCSFYHKCSSSRLSTDPEDVCISCNRAMSREMTYADGQDKKEDKLSNVDGFVKGVVTYMVMDDLVVKPMSTISSIAMLTKFHIKDVGALEEKVVDLDMSQGLKLLKASLESKNVLTRVFL